MNTNEFTLMSKDYFDSFFNLMKNSFPSIEMRNYEGQLSLFDDPNYRVIINKDDDENVISLMAIWEFDKFSFVEHIAVHEKLRGQGIGKILLSKYISECNKPILLEVEHPDTDIAARRIGFYERLGFNLNNFDYLQPPLQEGHPFYPLKVMSYPNPINELEFNEFRDTVYKKVYKINSK